MKFTVIASAFAAVKAQDFNEQAQDLKHELTGGDVANDVTEITFANLTLYADEGYTVYVDGNVVHSGFLNYRDANTWVTSNEIAIRQGWDTIAIELDQGRGDGLVGGTLDGMPSVAADWKCISQEYDDPISEGWNMNEFDDSAWPEATFEGNNTEANGPYVWRGRTVEGLPAETEFFYGPDWRQPLAFCRMNQRPLEERIGDSDVCVPVMDDFIALINEAVNHYEMVVSGLEATRKARDDTILELGSNLENINHNIDTTQGQLEDEEGWRADDLETYAGEIANLNQLHIDQTTELIGQLDTQCQNDLSAKETALETEWTNNINELNAEHEGIVNALHISNAAAKEQALNNQHEELTTKYSGLQNDFIEEHNAFVLQKEAEYAGVISNIEGAHADALIDLDATHKQQIADAEAALNTAHEAEVQGINDQFDLDIQAIHDHYTNLIAHEAEVMGDQIDELTKKHDYLYEACTTVQVVDGELHVE